MDSQRVSDEQKVGVPGVSLAALIPLNAAAIHAGEVGQLVL